MGQEQIPEDVERFLTDNIDSVPHLEALLLLWETAPREWTKDELASRIYVSTTAAEALLDQLSRRDLVTRLPGEPARFRFEVASEGRRGFMEKVAATYRRHLVRVAQFIHGKASGSVRDFARAFKLKSDDK